MYISKIKLKNFRNFTSLNLNFSNKLNLIIGNNGSGKTNLVEAIYVLALTKTFRNVVDNVLIKDDQDESIITGTIKSNIVHNYQIEITKKGKKAKINSNSIKKLSDYISNILIVFFSTNDFKLINDSPNLRRKLLNIEISQLNNNYINYLKEYNNIVKQRNAYLKILYTNRTTSVDYLNILTEKMIDYGLLIMTERKKFINYVNNYIENIFDHITGINHLKIIYKSDYLDKEKEELLNKHKKNNEKDIIFGKTLIGIHRDDIEFNINGKNLKDYGSEGQQKNAIISFKLSEVKIFQEIKNQDPILIIDDLYSELDNKKIHNILKIIDEKIQTIITITDLNKVKKDIRLKANIIKINNGEVR